jgi:hypothetical protein
MNWPLISVGIISGRLTVRALGAVVKACAEAMRQKIAEIFMAEIGASVGLIL